MTEPKASPKAPAVTPARAEAVPPKRKRILLVEGDGFTRLVLLLQLRMVGFAMEFTSNGSIALSKLRNCAPDALLVELKLCGLSGLDLIKAARGDSAFGDRPVYVFTRGDLIKRASSRELERLRVKVFDKNLMTREDVVQALVSAFRGKRTPEQPKPGAHAAPKSAQEAVGENVPGESVPAEAIEQIIAGVRDEAEKFAKSAGTDSHGASGNELLSRVRSLAHCADAAALPKVARQAKALENFVTQLCKNQQGCTPEALSTVTQSVDIMKGICSKGAAKEQSPSKLTAVVVDEEPLSNRALEKALSNVGFTPASFQDAAHAREHLASHQAGLILVNLPFPEGHGLDLRDIRRLPLHTQTPVVFGPHSGVHSALDDALATRGARLDTQPLLLTELVVRALNEVASPSKPAKNAAAPQPSTSRAVPPSIAAPAAAAAEPFEDYVELFARPAGRESLVNRSAPALSASVSAPEVQQPTQWSALSVTQEDSVTIPENPILRAQPATTDVDRTAEFVSSLPEAPPIDRNATDDHSLEELPPTAFPVEETEAAQPEPTFQGQTSETVGLTATAGEIAQPLSVEDATSEFVPAEPESVQESANHEEIMNEQAQAIPAEYSQEAQESQAGEVSAAPQSAEERCAELELQLASFRQAFADFSGGSEQQQQGLARAEEHARELEQRLNAATAELEQQRAAQQTAEAELRRELEAVKAASHQNEATRQEAQAHCAQLEQELAGLRQAQQELAGLRQAQQELAEKLAQNLKAEGESTARQQSAPGEADSGAPASELEHQVRQGVAALARATAELANERGERQRSDQRAADLTERLQALHEDLRRTLQAQREDLARISALEEKQREATQALDQRTADLEQEQAERRLAQEHLEKAKEVNAQLRKDLAFFEEANKKFGGSREELQARFEASLAAARENEARLQQQNAERQQLGQTLDSLQRELQEQSRKRENLEQELQSTRDALQNCEAKLQKETAERQRLSDSLDSLHRNSHDGSARDLEFSKLQAALEAEQVERKRQETQLAHLRHRAWDAVHAARGLRTSLRRQIRVPVDGLVHSTRSLLELEMGDAQKQLAEAVLQDALLVQTRLRDPELAHGDTETITPATATAT